MASEAAHASTSADGVDDEDLAQSAQPEAEEGSGEGGDGHVSEEYDTDESVDSDDEIVFHHEPIVQAVMDGDLAEVQRLARDLGVARVQETRSAYNSPLVVTAAYSGRLDILQWLVRECGCDVDAAGAQERTAFLSACYTGKMDCVRWLAGEGNCNVNAVSDSRSTAAHWAAAAGEVQVLEFLVHEVGLALDMVDGNRLTALGVACTNGHLQAVRFLAETPSGRSAAHRARDLPISLATQFGHLDVVRFWVEEVGASGTDADTDGITPLHVASIFNQLEIAQYLIAHAGANPQQRSNNGSTALIWAAASGEGVDVARWLLEQELSSIDEQDYFANTALHLASTNNRPD